MSLEPLAPDRLLVAPHPCAEDVSGAAGLFRFDGPRECRRRRDHYPVHAAAARAVSATGSAPVSVTSTTATTGAAAAAATGAAGGVLGIASHTIDFLYRPL